MVIKMDRKMCKCVNVQTESGKTFGCFEIESEMEILWHLCDRDYCSITSNQHTQTHEILWESTKDFNFMLMTKWIANNGMSYDLMVQRIVQSFDSHSTMCSSFISDKLVEFFCVCVVEFVVVTKKKKKTRKACVCVCAWEIQ